MHETEQVTRLIGDIYDAALDRSLWPVVLEKACGFVKGASAAIVAQDPLAGAGQFYFSWGVDPDYERSYLRDYIKLNTAAMIALCSAKVGEVISTELLMPYGEYLASRFHVEWARPQGYCDFVGALLDKTATSFASVSIVRHERHGTTDDATRRRLGLLVPHFRRAVNIGKVIDLHELNGAALADTLDGLAAATFLVEADAGIVHANARGQAMLADGIVLRERGGKLLATDPATDQALHEAFTAAGAGDVAMGTKGIAVPLAPGGGDPFVAHVLALTSGATRQAVRGGPAVAALFVCQTALDLPHPMAMVADLYKLTPAELRVLVGIVNIGGVPEVAPMLGVSVTTVKTHLQRVFEKTGTKRQADLVKLVAGYMSPLRR